MKNNNEYNFYEDFTLIHDSYYFYNRLMYFYNEGYKNLISCYSLDCNENYLVNVYIEGEKVIVEYDNNFELWKSYKIEYDKNSFFENYAYDEYDLYDTIKDGFISFLNHNNIYCNFC